MEFDAYGRTQSEFIAALRASPETGWQPIETAPKDGWVACGYWYAEGCWVWGRGCYRFDEHHPEGYFIMDGGGKPTHWMLLPAPVEVPHA